VRILVARNHFHHNNRLVDTYSGSMVRVLRERGYAVVDVPKNPNQNYDGIDLVIDVDSGRNEKGHLIWQAQDGRLPVPSAVMFIDSHGYPSLHKRLSVNYDHVFYAVYDKRDLFAKHPSATWLPNFTDSKWFDGVQYAEERGSEHYDFSFYGSKGGLNRTDRMVQIANDNNWRVDARQVSPGHKHQWPHTAEAMAQSRNFFNKGQRHDSPNLRVMESMLMMKPLISDQDPRSGMDKLFTPMEHYIPYEYFTYDGLETAMKWVMENPGNAASIAANAYIEVKSKHLVEHRIDQILEVIND